MLHTGPKLLNNICDVVYQFHKNNIVFSSDIHQMYQQIKITQPDKPYQQIIWHSNKTTTS